MHVRDSDQSNPSLAFAHHPGLSTPTNPTAQEHVWFWEAGLKVRTLAMLIPIYHDIVGRGMTMELAFSIDRDGLVEDTHAAMYAALGNWVRTCYGSPVAETTVAVPTLPTDPWVYALKVPVGAVFDRVQLREDTVVGQRVRNYTVAVNGMTVATGQSIGIKRIFLLGANFTGTASSVVELRVHSAIAPPVLAQFAAFAPCPSS
jgi:alpha-L-fucosidase